MLAIGLLFEVGEKGVLCVGITGLLDLNLELLWPLIFNQYLSENVANLKETMSAEHPRISTLSNIHQ